MVKYMWVRVQGNLHPAFMAKSLVLQTVKETEQNNCRFFIFLVVQYRQGKQPPTRTGGKDMTFKISGFGAEQQEKKAFAPTCEQAAATPRKSVVQVRFPDRGMALSYYNDQFDLKLGDLVYVDGKQEGQLGRITEVSYNFKIKVSEYKKVIAVVDTKVSGQFFMAGSHFVTFDPAALPATQAVTWFKAPDKEGDEFASGSDDTSFPLADLKEMKVNGAVAERGRGYYTENRVRYLCLDGTKGLAVVDGSRGYVIEFEYRQGQISHLICDCPCSYTCKHEFAAMLQLKETLEVIEKQYSEKYARTGYVAAIQKGTLFTFAIDGREEGSFTL